MSLDLRSRRMHRGNNLVQGLPMPWAFPEVSRYWDTRQRVTASGERVSNWLDMNLGTDLAQASGAAQPILLPYAGVNYFWRNAAGNSVTAPLSLSGSIDIDAYIAANDWTAATQCSVAGKWLNAGNQYGFVFQVEATTGLLVLNRTTTGAIGTSVGAKSTAAPVISDFAGLYIRATLVAATGAVTFYTSPATDGVNWTRLGDVVSTAATGIFGSSADLSLFENADLTSQGLVGKGYRVRIYDGPRQSGGTLVFDANFTAVPEGATSFTESSANAATVTINSTGAKPAQIVGSQQILFDGAAHFLRTANFTLNQPVSYVACARINSYGGSGNKVILNGTQSHVALYCPGSSTNIAIYAGSVAAAAAGPAVGAYSALSAIMNGASSQWAANLETPNTGNPGAGNPGGVTLAASNVGAATLGAISIKSVAVCNSALFQSRLNQLIRAMAIQSGISV